MAFVEFIEDHFDELAAIAAAVTRRPLGVAGEREA